MVVSLSPQDRRKLDELRRIKLLATASLAFCFGLMVLAKIMEARNPQLGPLIAFAEAATIGGLADWYAVVALFKRPLGLEIPHTEIIPRNQDRIADNLGEFIEENFLDEDVIRAKLAEIDFADGIGNALADPARAQAALAIVRFMDEGFGDRVVFDLTTNGFGATLNLLTFAFRPPFLAATICLCLAMFVLGWRAFFRFGPAVAQKRQTAFGKAQLVTNGADLIVRGNRLALLTKPYAALAARRMAGNLGLTTHDPQAIDASLQAKQAGAPSFVKNTAELTTATSSDAVLSAAQALYEQSRRPETDSRGHTQK